MPVQEEGAIKWWIGNAAEDGRMATVFARLVGAARLTRPEKMVTS
jgi:hypothetical protein